MNSFITRLTEQLGAFYIAVNPFTLTPVFMKDNRPRGGEIPSTRPSLTASLEYADGLDDFQGWLGGGSPWGWIS